MLDNWCTILGSLPTIGFQIRTHDGAQANLEHTVWSMLFAHCLLHSEITGVCHHSEGPSLLLCCDKTLTKTNLAE